MANPRLAVPLEASSRPATRGRRVLVADDDGETVAWVCDALATEGFELVCAYDGAELVRALVDHGPFDLIITDIGMPWAEGTAVIRAARASALSIPVLFVSGASRADLAAAVAKLGNARLLQKPLGAAALRSAVLDLLEARLE